MKETILKIIWVTLGLSFTTYAGLYLYLDYAKSEISIHGHIAMAIGIFFSYAVGAALMGLLFFSNKHGHDAEVHFISENASDKTK